MRRYLALLAVAVGFPAFLAAQTAATVDPCARHISVEGTAEVLVEPDTVTIRIGVDTSSPTAKQALAANHEAVSRVVAVAKDAGISPDDIVNDYVRLRSSTEEKPKGHTATVYEAQETLSIKLSKIDRYSQLLRSLVEAGGNRIDSVDFSSSKVATQRDEARRLALDAARRKAELMTKQAKVKLGVVCTLQEGSGEYGYTGLNAGFVNVVTKSGSGAEYNTSGKIAVSSTVSVTFAIE